MAGQHGGWHIGQVACAEAGGPRSWCRWRVQVGGVQAELTGRVLPAIPMELQPHQGVGGHGHAKGG